MALDLTQKTDPPAPLTAVQILIGYKPPKNWKENLVKQKDEGYQELLKQWLDEDDPELKDTVWQEAKKYWAKRRLLLGFENTEE